MSLMVLRFKKKVAKRRLAIRLQGSFLTVTVDAIPSRVKPGQTVSVSGLVSVSVSPLPFRTVTVHICDEAMSEIERFTLRTDLQGEYETSVSFSDPGRYNIYSETYLAESGVAVVEVYAPPAPRPLAPPSPPPPVKAVKSRNLNFGTIKLLEDGRYYLSYSAPGYGADIYGDAEYMRAQADRIDSIADDDIEYLTKYQDYIRAGKCVGECVNKKFMTQDKCYGPPPSVEDACEAYQGGFTGHIWTIEEIETEKKPYYNMKDDANAIREFVA